MVRVIEIEKSELSKIVFDIYNEDLNHIKKIHKLKVEESLNDIEKLVSYVSNTMSSISDEEFIFKLDLDGEAIGFFTLLNVLPHEVTQLNGFHISKNHRTKEVLKSLWEGIEKNAKKNIICGLYEENKDAINHLKKNGFEEQEYMFFDEYDKNFLILNKKNK